MKKTKRKAVINLIIFFLLLAGGIYMAIAGVGQNESGKTANVPLGLDLQGGLSVTYEIQDEKPTSDEIKATVDKLQRRVDAYSSEGEVYQEGTKTCARRRKFLRRVDEKPKIRYDIL